jgi:transposase
MLRNFGLKVGVVSAAGFEVRIRVLIEEMPDLASIIEPLLTVRKKLRETSTVSKLVHGPRRWMTSAL